MSREPEHDLVHDARAGIVAMIDDARPEPCWDDVLARARALHPSRFGSEDDEPVVHLHDRAKPASAAAHPDDAEFGAWIDDARQAVQRTVQQRRRQPVPAAPVVDRPRRSTLRWAVAGLATVAAAAAVLMLLDTRPLSLSEADSGSPGQAARSVQSGDTTGTAEAVERVQPERAMPPRAPAVSPAPPPPDVEPAVEPERVAPSPQDRTRGTSRRADRQARLAALAAEAQARWRAGDHAGARQRFATIVRVGGRSRAAELAYGDLFALARQAGQAKEQRTLWRAYLRRFARGRFADDARAGLCRQIAADTDARRTCWRRYLDDFPKGSFRSEARRSSPEGSP